VFLFPGNPTRDFIYIEDVLTANYLSSIDFEKSKGRYFEVSTGVSSSFEECLEIFGIDFRYVSESEIPTGYQFFTKGDPIKWLPSWKPNYSLEEGLLHYRRYLEETKNGA
jgi:nucleoside-diphosphate-sugar epimerase